MARSSQRAGSRGFTRPTPGERREHEEALGFGFRALGLAALQEGFRVKRVKSLECRERVQGSVA